MEGLSKVFENSRALLEATWNMQSDRVAEYIQNSHYETSLLQYNDENALAYKDTKGMRFFVWEKCDRTNKKASSRNVRILFGLLMLVEKSEIYL